MRVFHRTLERIAPLGWHLVLHLDAADIVELAPLLRGLRLPFIIDHMGRVKADAGLAQAPFRALLGLVKLDTCWVKVCGAERVSTAGRPSPMPSRSRGRWSRRRRTACCGAPTGRIPTSRATCPMMAISSTSCR